MSGQIDKAWDSLIDALTVLTEARVIKWDGDAAGDPPQAGAGLVFRMSQTLKREDLKDPLSSWGYVPCLKTWNASQPNGDQVLAEKSGANVLELLKAIRSAK